MLCFFFKPKTAYELRISDWSSDVCSSDLDALEMVGYVPSAARSAQCVVALRPSNSPASARISAPAQTEPRRRTQNGRASCRERVCQYVSISVVAGILKKKEKIEGHTSTTSTENSKTSTTTQRMKIQ